MSLAFLVHVVIQLLVSPSIFRSGSVFYDPFVWARTPLTERCGQCDPGFASQGEAPCVRCDPVNERTSKDQ